MKNYEFQVKLRTTPGRRLRASRLPRAKEDEKWKKPFGRRTRGAVRLISQRDTAIVNAFRWARLRRAEPSWVRGPGAASRWSVDPPDAHSRPQHRLAILSRTSCVRSRHAVTSEGSQGAGAWLDSSTGDGPVAHYLRARGVDDHVAQHLREVRFFLDNECQIYPGKASGSARSCHRAARVPRRHRATQESSPRKIWTSRTPRTGNCRYHCGCNGEERRCDPIMARSSFFGARLRECEERGASERALAALTASPAL
jgi:hypothetical protein